MQNHNSVNVSGVKIFKARYSAKSNIAVETTIARFFAYFPSAGVALGAANHTHPCGCCFFCSGWYVVQKMTTSQSLRIYNPRSPSSRTVYRRWRLVFEENLFSHLPHKVCMDHRPDIFFFSRMKEFQRHCSKRCRKIFL